MVAQGRELLHFVELLQEVGSRGVFLAVDGFLLQCREQFAKRHRRRVGAHAAEGGEVHRVFHGADLEPLQVGRCLNFMHVVGQLAEAVFPEGHADDAVVGERGQILLTKRAVEHLVGDFFIGEQERQVKDHPFLVQTGDRRGRGAGHFQRAGA